MNTTTALRHYRLAAPLILAAMLMGCGQGDDKGKVEKKVEPAAPPKTTTAPPVKEAPKAEAPKPAPAAQKASAKAEADGWTLLGSQQANVKGERERITVESSQKGVKSLMVVVEGAPVEIDEMIVTFRNEKQHTLKVKQNLEANSASPSIDLPGEKRAVKHIDFSYRTSAKGSGRATVMVYGR